MKVRGRRFAVDKANGKIAGVCAGLGESTGLDVNLVRIGFVLFAVIGSVIGALLVYGLLAMAGSPQRNGEARRSRLAPACRDDRPLDDRLRAHERRMKEIDTFVAGSNSRLAREIEDLRN